MAKLPKKKTMVDTITRVQGYASKLFQNDKFTSKDYASVVTTLNKLKKSLDK